MKLSEWQNSGKIFHYKNYEIFYKEENELNTKKETILLIHGFPTASWDWQAIWYRLSEKFNLLTLDMIGFGFSDKPKHFLYSINEQANLLEAFLEFKNIENYHILCHDYGVTVAQELLARLEDKHIKEHRILSVAFLNGGLFPETHRPRFIQKLLLSPIGFLVSRLLTKKKFAKSFSAVFGLNKPSHSEINDFWDLVRYKDGHLLAHKHIAYMTERKTFRSSWVGVLLKTKVPIVLINGPADPISGIHMVEYFRKLNSEVHAIMLPDNVGHYPQVENPDAVLSAYFSFIKTLSIP